MKIDSTKLDGFIRENFGKITGTLSCSNPHWWLHFYDDKIAYEYECCESEDCDSQEFITYKDADSLIADKPVLVDVGCYWWWKNA